MIYIGLILLTLLLGSLFVILTKEKHSKLLGTIFSGLALLIVLIMFISAFLSGNSIQSENYGIYIVALNIYLHFQINAISLILTIMCSIITFAAIFGGNVESSNSKGKTLLLLLFEFSSIAFFTSANLFLFYIFLDLGILFAFFMLYLYGSANKRKASIKFLAYEFSASMLLLIAIILIYFSAHTLNISSIMQNANIIPRSTQVLIFIFLLLAFIINMPIFPFHFWLPDAHTEASTQGSMILSGVLTKFGAYGVLLTFLMLPISHNSSIQIILLLLGGFSAFYAAFVIITQHDLKRIIAYSAIVEMSIVLIGIASLTTIGFDGAVIALFAQGVTIALMFLSTSSIIHIFAEHNILLIKGAARNALSSAYTFMIGIFLLGGVPLSIGFIGDLLIFIGAFSTFSIFGIIPIFALVILILFLYYINSKAIFNISGECSKNINFINTEQEIAYVILISTLFIFGILPFLFINLLKLFP
ncbi:MAG: NADH-quinone oxidoreductase subunit M [Candidatus Marsarchaeota archaeon]|jgi:NADH-quinone oxidoreductase subunit M|nr:NADH-quinone oxidoreductase subunit M [Candidatus Marsarchaeota archaeon]